MEDVMNTPLANMNQAPVLPVSSTVLDENTKVGWIRNKWDIFLILFIVVTICAGFWFLMLAPSNKKNLTPSTFIAGNSYTGIWSNGTSSKLTILSVDGNKVVCFYEWGENKKERKKEGNSTENATIQPDGKLIWKRGKTFPFITFTGMQNGSLAGTWELNNRTMSITMFWVDNKIKNR